MEENEIINMLDQLADFKSQADYLELEKKKLLNDAIPMNIKTHLGEIEAEFADKEEAVKTNIASLEERIKKSVLEIGSSVKGRFLHAVYSKGRTTWDNDFLNRFAKKHPEIESARKEGDPSVSMRNIS